MSGHRRKPVGRKPPSNKEGWITKNKTNHEFGKVTHSTRAAINYQSKRDFPLDSHTTKASILKKNKPSYVTPTKSQMDTKEAPLDIKYVNNLYKTQPNISTTVNNDVARYSLSQPSNLSSSAELHLSNPYKTKENKFNIKSKSTNTVTRKEEDIPSPLSLIKQQNKIYYIYDPRGYPTEPLPLNYCRYCRCPMVYCSEVVFGVMSLNHAKTLAYSPGPHCTLEKEDMKELFDRAFTKLVFAKLRWNGFDLSVKETETSFRSLKIPRCVKKQSLKKIFAIIEEYNYPTYDEDDYDEEKEEEDLQKER